MTAAATQKVLATIDREFDASMARLFDFLRFPSIGTDPAFHADCRRTAQWLKGQLDGMGFSTSIHPTVGQPDPSAASWCCAIMSNALREKTPDSLASCTLWLTCMR